MTERGWIWLAITLGLCVFWSAVVLGCAFALQAFLR